MEQEPAIISSSGEKAVHIMVEEAPLRVEMFWQVWGSQIFTVESNPPVANMLPDVFKDKVVASPL